MKVIIFGATGMVGSGVLRECLLDPDVKFVKTIGRTSSKEKHPKLREIILPDLMNLSSIKKEIKGFDACFFCLGISSVGLSEKTYREITYDITLSVATALAKLNPKMTFTYVSGAGTDSSEKGKIMWARVKGKTENDLLKLPFKAAYMFRPAMIQPLYGIKSKTSTVRIVYQVLKPVLPLLRTLFPAYVTTTQQIGRAMLFVAKQGYPKKILEGIDISQII